MFSSGSRWWSSSLPATASARRTTSTSRPRSSSARSLWLSRSLTFSSAGFRSVRRTGASRGTSSTPPPWSRARSTLRCGLEGCPTGSLRACSAPCCSLRSLRGYGAPSH
eukprot:Amastigsp_a342756_45.p4 type:complete len:109 gc:universal Amastigsp_a342756_45:471-797(+)